jgi:hypothetical protein
MILGDSELNYLIKDRLEFLSKGKPEEIRDYLKGLEDFKRTIYGAGKMIGGGGCRPENVICARKDDPLFITIVEYATQRGIKIGERVADDVANVAKGINPSVSNVKGTGTGSSPLKTVNGKIDMSQFGPTYATNNRTFHENALKIDASIARPIDEYAPFNVLTSFNEKELYIKYGILMAQSAEQYLDQNFIRFLYPNKRFPNENQFKIMFCYLSAVSNFQDSKIPDSISYIGFKDAAYLTTPNGQKFIVALNKMRPQNIDTNFGNLSFMKNYQFGNRFKAFNDDGVIKKSNLKLVQISGNGDCLLNSVAYSLLSLFREPNVETRFPNMNHALLNLLIEGIDLTTISDSKTYSILTKRLRGLIYGFIKYFGDYIMRIFGSFQRKYYCEEIKKFHTHFSCTNGNNLNKFIVEKATNFMYASDEMFALLNAGNLDNFLGRINLENEKDERYFYVQHAHSLLYKILPNLIQQMTMANQNSHDPKNPLKGRSTFEFTTDHNIIQDVYFVETGPDIDDISSGFALLNNIDYVIDKINQKTDVNFYSTNRNDFFPIESLVDGSWLSGSDDCNILCYLLGFNCIIVANAVESLVYNVYGNGVPTFLFDHHGGHFNVYEPPDTPAPVLNTTQKITKRKKR